MAPPYLLNTHLHKSSKKNTACFLGLSSGCMGWRLYLPSQKGIQTSCLHSVSMRAGSRNATGMGQRVNKSIGVQLSPLISRGGFRTHSLKCAGILYQSCISLFFKVTEGVLEETRTKGFPSVQLSALAPKLKTSQLFFRSYDVCSFQCTAAPCQEKAKRMFFARQLGPHWLGRLTETC